MTLTPKKLEKFASNLVEHQSRINKLVKKRGLSRDQTFYEQQSMLSELIRCVSEGIVSTFQIGYVAWEDITNIKSIASNKFHDDNLNAYCVNQILPKVEAELVERRAQCTDILQCMITIQSNRIPASIPNLLLTFSKLPSDTPNKIEALKKITIENICKRLINELYIDSTNLHRIILNFIIQDRHLKKEQKHNLQQVNNNPLFDHTLLKSLDAARIYCSPPRFGAGNWGLKLTPKFQYALRSRHSLPAPTSIYDEVRVRPRFVRSVPTSSKELKVDLEPTLASRLEAVTSEMQHLHLTDAGKAAGDLMPITSPVMPSLNLQFKSESSEKATESGDRQSHHRHTPRKKHHIK